MAFSISAKKHVLVIGAGPQGLATGIELLEKGYDVTILEAKDKLGQGVSYRPDYNTHGTLHSGAYYLPGSERSRMARAMYDMIEGSEGRGRVMEIYRRNSKPSGKLIIARTDEGVATIASFQERLAGSKVKCELHTTAAAIFALDEPTIGDPNAIKAVLSLPNVGIINIPKYIADLKEAFLSLGGTLMLSHEVTGFTSPTAIARQFGMGITYKFGGTEHTIYADTVINLAGLYVVPVAKLAAAAINHFPEAEIPETPDVRYDRYYVLVEKDRTRAVRPTTKQVVYSADRAILDGPKSTVGVHSFCSDELSPGRYAMTFGNYMVQGISESEIGNTNPEIPPVSEEWWEKAEAIYPGINRDDYELRFIGRIGNPLTRDGKRDFFYTESRLPNGGFSVLNCFTSDSPGLTCSPLLAQEISQKVSAILARTSSRDVA